MIEPKSLAPLSCSSCALTECSLPAFSCGAGAVTTICSALSVVLSWVTAAIAALALVLPVWAAAAIVAAVLLIAAAVAAVIGKKQVEQAPAAAQHVVASVTEDVNTVKEARHGRN